MRDAFYLPKNLNARAILAIYNLMRVLFYNFTLLTMGDDRVSTGNACFDAKLKPTRPFF